jgi:amino acid transporter
LKVVNCVCTSNGDFAKMSIEGIHDAPGKTANVGAYGVHENVHHGDFVTENEERDLRRGLGQRHIQMIALAGKS